MAAARPLAVQEQSAILEALDRLRDRVLVLCGIYTGFRIHELLGLYVGDIWRAGQPAVELTVARRHLKGGASATARRVRSRTVALNAHLRAALQTYVVSRFGSGPVDIEAVLFPSRKGVNRPISAVQAYRIIKQAAVTVGDGTRVSTHSLRKTFARAVYDGSGHDIILTQRAVGHSSVLTTARYLESSQDDVTKAVLGMDGPLCLGGTQNQEARPQLAAIGAHG